MSSADEEKSRGQFLGFFLIIVLLCMIFIVMAARSSGCQDGVQQTPDPPCREQAPLECLVDTVEQASDSQFDHYVYCACMTDDGSAKGYIATRLETDSEWATRPASNTLTRPGIR